MPDSSGTGRGMHKNRPLSALQSQLVPVNILESSTILSVLISEETVCSLPMFSIVIKWLTQENWGPGRDQTMFTSHAMTPRVEDQSAFRDGRLGGSLAYTF